MSITQEELKRQLCYDPSTGLFTWAIRKPKVKFGAIAGKIKANGYVEIRVNLISYFSHRLAWLYVYGEMPTADIDHINRDPGDNRIDNLRLATRAQNLCNVGALTTSMTGERGVDFHKASGKYRARIRYGGKRVELGLFDSIAKAAAAYKEAAEKHHGEFAAAPSLLGELQLPIAPKFPQTKKAPEA
ncbi:MULTISPECIES: HNH endonuclease [Pseudomonas]|uniref:HNH endonuclease n=1 Tax=Pseudomonas TaxID=286 RepID=UPI0026D86B83